MCSFLLNSLSEQPMPAGTCRMSILPVTTQLVGRGQCSSLLTWAVFVRLWRSVTALLLSSSLSSLSGQWNQQQVRDLDPVPSFLSFMNSDFLGQTFLYRNSPGLGIGSVKGIRETHIFLHVSSAIWGRTTLMSAIRGDVGDVVHSEVADDDHSQFTFRS